MPFTKSSIRHGRSLILPIILSFAIWILAAPTLTFGITVTEWNFSKGLQGWIGNQRVDNLSYSSEGLIVQSIGEDPWIEGPTVNLPIGKMITVQIRMKSSADTNAELFYGMTFSAGHSVRFTVRNDGQWFDYNLVIRENLGRQTRFRLDPCTGPGEVTIAFIKIEAIDEIAAAPLEKPQRPAETTDTPILVESTSLEFEHYGGRWGNFVFKVNGMDMAAGYECELLGVVIDDRTEWLNLKNAVVTFENRPEREEFESKAVIKDSGGATWEIQKIVKPAGQEGTLVIETELKVNTDRDVIHVPWLTIFPGLGTFGQEKQQGLFAGLEYLCNEPSSSTADIETPEHLRLVPDPIKITFPLMAVIYGDCYIGVIWEPSDMVAATFDSPDGIYDSGAHVMGLSAPAVGGLRFENDFCAHTPFKLEANQTLKVSMLIVGGEGNTVVPAIRRYVELKGLPALPQFEGDFSAAVDLLAHGWLDSQVNEDGLFRHAVWGDNFPAGPAADAAAFIDWLANHTKDGGLWERLDWAKYQALRKIPSGQPFSSGVGHAHLPTAPFIFGRPDEFVRQRYNEASGLLRNFDEDGVKLYRPGETDYSRTHFSKHANGLAGRDMAVILEAATLSADKELIDKALELLDKQTILYADTVPRGAQTWEVPLHTPDILASAHMVKAYALGYMISGRQEYLDQARYWAWTGIPFVYLQPPTSGRVGVYSTIAVLGATNWKAPLWLGQPVQWCGLVYCSALHLLSNCDPNGPWEQIAKGITVTGLQMSWPLSDKERQGLLPDFFDLRAQIAAGPAINPGTVQAHLAELYDKGTIYDVKKLPASGWFVHAPCAISDIRENEDCITFTVEGWGSKQFHVLISGIETEPDEIIVSPDKPNTPGLAETQYNHEQKILLITLKGKSEIQIK